MKTSVSIWNANNQNLDVMIIMLDIMKMFQNKISLTSISKY